MKKKTITLEMIFDAVESSEQKLREELLTAVAATEARLRGDILTAIVDTETRQDEKARQYRDDILTKRVEDVATLDQMKEDMLFIDRDVTNLKKRVSKLEATSKPQ